MCYCVQKSQASFKFSDVADYLVSDEINLCITSKFEL